MKTIRMGLMSLAHGHGHSYAKAAKALPGVRLAGIFDEDAARGSAAAQTYGCDFYADAGALLAAVDGVMICSDNRRHYPYAKEAAEAGVPILVEKPITTVPEEGRELIDLCAAKGIALQTAFPVRLNASFLKAKAQIEAGEIGEVLSIAATNHGKMPGGWFVDPERAGGGAVLDHTVHVVDMMRTLLRSEVQEVFAEVDTLLHDIPVDDCGMLSMAFENGVFATLDTSWSRPSSYPTWGDVTMRIVGSEGAIHLDAFAQAGSVWENGASPTHRLANWGDGSNESLVAEFASCIREGRGPRITGLDGLRAAEVAWAAYESAKAGQPVRVKRY